MSKSVAAIQKELGKLFKKIAEVQESQDLTCSCTDCYWNFTQSKNECISESLNEFKMTPNSLDCKGYWKR